MAEALAVVSIGLGVAGGQESAAAQKYAGEQAEAAGEATAQNIMLQSRETLRRMKEAQAGTLGAAIARAAASGITFDVEALREIEYEYKIDPTAVKAPKKDTKHPVMMGHMSYLNIMEPILGQETTDEFRQFEKDVFGKDVYEFYTGDTELGKEDPAAPLPSEPGGLVAGGPAGTSLEAYVHRAKSTFAREVAWEEAWSLSQANAARLGGEVLSDTAKAQAQATQTQAWGQAANTAYSVWG